ncbi:MAG: hypothetical protein GY795_20885 [Desulfobacterales bacterium]|nr:hypothetical protein [Desulfobacterales bacterium]
MSKKIVLWGHTDVGKTALLATYFEYESKRKKWIGDVTLEYFPQVRKLESNMERLRLHHQITPTASTSDSMYSFPTKLSEELTFVDIKGGDSDLHQLPSEKDGAIKQAIEEADAFLFVCEWPTHANKVLMQAAIQRILLFVRSKPKGLVITKAEQYMAPDDSRWEGGEGWLKFDDNWNQFASEFGDNFWPVTTFGYCKTTEQTGGLEGHPACVLNPSILEIVQIGCSTLEGQELKSRVMVSD